MSDSFKLDLLSFGRDQSTIPPNPHGIISIDKFTNRASLIEIISDEFSNPGVIELYSDSDFYGEWEFDEAPGVYFVELDVKDTTVDYGPGGIEYDCEAIIHFKQKLNFTTMVWEDYVQINQDNSSC